ncbi:MAG TPA: hypothetical protein ENI93_07875 [Gammaproteobacteria bacterium]|nr:hypothetical protein [Gammaproteobacteria bacterium]
MRRFHAGWWWLLFWALPVQAGPIAPEAVPEPLRPWQDWVLYEVPDHACPFLYSDARRRRCAWPSVLELDLDDHNGHFRQQWTVYRRSPVILPGDDRLWPQNVRVDGQPAAVVAQAGRPVIWLDPGVHRIEGDLLWRRLPERLRVPADTGLLRLRLRGAPVTAPVLGKDGRLWLKRQGRQQPLEDTLALTVQRRLVDDIPQRIVTRMEFKVSGRVREQVLGPVLPPRTVPLRLDSPLPARLEPDGRLRLQLRPGTWVVRLESRTLADQTAFARSAAPPPWPAEEIWVFEAQPDIRLVEVEGVSVDPRQTTLPPDWQKLPAYRLRGEEGLRLKVIRRGQAEPPPDRLSLDRSLWLDFDGAGYTVADRIRGSLGGTWRLETLPELDLGRVLVDGQPRFITRLPDSDRPGVEVRRGDLLLEAEARHAGRQDDLPVTGWAVDFQQVSTTLHLPPGWTLFAVSGVDNVPGTWLHRWTLLDLFLVLILSLAVYRLWGWRIGLLALVTLVVIWHESLAPRFVWIHLLLAMALLRVVHHEKMQRLLRIYRDLAFVALVLITIPFAVEQLRTAFYLQLERPGSVASMVIRAPETPSAAEAKAGRTAKPAHELLARSKAPVPDSARVIREVDPEAVVQTGPGLPRWTWRQVDLQWSGPVARDQRFSLTLIPPLGNRFLKVLRVALVVLLGGMLFLRARGGGAFFRWRPEAARAASVLLLLGLLGSLPPPVTAGEVKELPPPDILAELKKRLMAPADCLPACAHIARMDLQAGARRLRLDLEIHAAESVAVPLPSDAQAWMPAQVRVDGRVATRLYREPGGGLWIGLSPGRHAVTLIGPLSEGDSLVLPLPLKPGYVTTQADEWSISGVDENGHPEGQLRLDRKRPLQAPAGGQETTLAPRPLPPFVRVERTLRLGLEWQVETRVVRVSPPGTPVVLDVSLLDGEAPLDEDLVVRNGTVRVGLAPRQREVRWRSRLAMHSPLILRAPDADDRLAVWRVDVSPVWHLTSEGIPPIRRHDPANNRLIEWRPWPGETVTLNLTRPVGVPGPTLTLVGSERVIRPGRQATDTLLILNLRSSQGGQYALNLPENARLLALRVDGTELPARQQGRQVAIPLRPEAMNVELQWRTPNGIRPRYVSEPLTPGLPSVNAVTRLELGRDRWVLFTGGPRLGPAVLFWGMVVVIALLAVGLGRVRLTPLRTVAWFLFGIGLSQVPLWMSAMVVAWLFALGLRGRLEPRQIDGGIFNAMQAGLGLLTVIALLILFGAISQGLLGLPEMHVSGNGSTATSLNWYQDRVADALPEVWVVSVPLWVYRTLMLAWALWLAIALLGWLKWGWQCFSRGGLWYKPEKAQASATDQPASTKQEE